MTAPNDGLAEEFAKALYECFGEGEFSELDIERAAFENPRLARALAAYNPFARSMQ